MRTKTLSCAVMLALFPVVAMGACIKGGPFVCGGSVTINSMPQSENPIWTPPLASPSVTSSGILSAFYTSNMSQANPNSPQPVAPSCQYGGPGTSPGTYVWSGSDNTGWVLQGADCATSAQPVASCQYGGSPGSYTWNGSSWVLQGGNCAPAAPVASCPSGYGGSPGSYSWNGSSWILSGQNCTAPIINTGFIGGGGTGTQTNTAQAAAQQASAQAAAQQAALASGCPFGKTSTGQYYNFAPIGAETHNTGDASIMPGWVWAGRNTYSCYGS